MLISWISATQDCDYEVNNLIRDICAYLRPKPQLLTSFHCEVSRLQFNRMISEHELLSHALSCQIWQNTGNILDNSQSNRFGLGLEGG